MSLVAAGQLRSRPAPTLEWERDPGRECIIRARIPDVVGYRVGGLVRSVWSMGGFIRVYSPCDCPTSYDLIVLEYADGDEISVPIINVPPCDGD